MEKFKTGRYTDIKIDADGVGKNWFIGGKDNFEVVCCYMELPSGWSYGAHLHKERAEVIIVVAGKLVVKIEQRDEVVLSPGDFLSVAKNTPLKLATRSEGGANVIFVHPSGSGENDTEFLEPPETKQS